MFYKQRNYLIWINSFNDVKIMSHSYPELFIFMYLYFVFMLPPRKKTEKAVLHDALCSVAYFMWWYTQYLLIGFTYKAYVDCALCYRKKNLRTALRIVCRGYNVIYSFMCTNRRASWEKTIWNTFPAINVILTCGFIAST